MKKIIGWLFVILFCGSVGIRAQNNARKIYETEKEFEKAVAEKGIRDGFIEFLAADGIIFRPAPINGRASWQSRPASPAALFWNPVWIDVSGDGALAFSIGNSVYHPQGKDDPNAYYGHYLSIWRRQSDGSYRAALDLGIGHEKPAAIVTEWQSPAAFKTGTAKKSAAIFFAEYTTAVEKKGAVNGYRKFLAADAILMRDEHEPFVGKSAALAFLAADAAKIKFAPNEFFQSADNMAYVINSCSKIKSDGTIVEQGNLAQVWKLRGGKWQIVADVWLALPAQK